ncbi:hypothetical protein H0X06_00270 [Candidatus Dependentiae bacterium]|nr:hypothetical protein [Candidatus Dependentiae bacterium]
MKTIRLFYILVLLACTSPLKAREIRTPLSVERGPLSELYTELNRECWTVSAWGSYYQKSARKSFNHRGTEGPLSTLFFNKPQFSAQEAFFQNTAAVITNPLLATSVLGPRVKYKESGIGLGINCQKWFCDFWRCGLRTQLPVKKVHVKRTRSCGNGTSDLGGQTPASLAIERIEKVNGVPVNSFAYRLDFLSRLPYTCLPCPARDFLIVNYRDIDFPPNNPLTISNQDITTQNLAPVTALRNSRGCVPSQTFAITQQEALQLPSLSADGTSISANSRANFDATTSYVPLGMDLEQQARIFIVPSVADNRVVAPARVIRQHVNELLGCIDQEAEAIFKQCGISFASQCSRGIGDFDTELFLGHFFSECFYTEIYGGVKWPTGKRACDPRLVFQQPLGNNGHYEYKLGIQSLFQLHPWIAVQGQLTWHTVQRKRECIATAFQGACVKNIGLPTIAHSAWDYVVFRTDLFITPPLLCNSGLDINYELYYKGRDTVCFKNPTAVDCLGNSPLLDSTVITRNTKVISQKIKAELFYNFTYLELFAGGSRVFSGRNAPKETDWHIGLACYF